MKTWTTIPITYGTTNLFVAWLRFAYDENGRIDQTTVEVVQETADQLRVRTDGPSNGEIDDAFAAELEKLGITPCRGCGG